MRLELNHHFDIILNSGYEEAALAGAGDSLEQLASVAYDNDQVEIAQGATRLFQLLQLFADCQEAVRTESTLDELPEELQTATLLEAMKAGLTHLQDALDGNAEGDHSIARWCDEIRNRWESWLPSSPLLTADTTMAADLSAGEDNGELPTAGDLAQYLRSVTTKLPESRGSEPTTEVPESAPAETLTSIEPPGGHDVVLDKEMQEAFLDDANRCVNTMEQSLLQCSGEHTDQNTRRSICRELHTLKGASASVRLSSLADYLHRIESHLETEQHSGAATTPTVNDLLHTVDIIRRSIALCCVDSARRETPNDSSPIPSPTTLDLEEDSLRVPASRIDRLMDMLAELVMLRNQRESQLADLRQRHEELFHCATRLRMASDAKGVRESTHDLREIGMDLFETARGQGELLDTLLEGNLSVSRFIRSFRHELTALRRLPISGLFQRLQRAVREAAQVEQKQVRFALVGEHAGLERSLQDRLYEPLLHLVRNAVSHGIEDADTRVANGKDGTGTIVLEARGSSSLLVLTVRDDGKGLDYDGLRRRGIEMGLLSPDQDVSRSQLAHLIFHPGFSTRQTANAVSGRGVGMDIVMDTLQRMGSWIEIESEPGAGTQLRLHVPLPSVIENAMLFRSGGKLFAVPMQSLVAATDSDSSELGSSRCISLHERLEFAATASSERRQRLLLANPSARESFHAPQHDGKQPSGTWELEVDEIVGPEEVVVRPLPPLLRNHPLLRGITLAGNGDVVLLLDPRFLHQLMQAHLSADAAETEVESKNCNSFENVLLVDDSLSARRTLARLLGAEGFETIEASSAQQALDRFENHELVAVFTDLEMPGMTGFDLLREIRRQTEHLPVIVVSSRDEPEFEERAREMGASAYITKPVTETRLQAVLNELATSPTPSLEGVPS